MRLSPASNRSLVGFLMYAFSCNAESAQASRGATLPGLKGCEKTDRKAYSLALRRKALVDWIVLLSNSSPGGEAKTERGVSNEDGLRHVHVVRALTCLTLLHVSLGLLNQHWKPSGKR